jgi:menaquinone reductase, multiheme cytochrome c subunit
VKRSLLLFFLPLIIFTLISYCFSLKACDYAMHLQAKKAVPFNHKSHTTTYGAADCEMCHKYYDNGRFKGIPVIGECKQCHENSTAFMKVYYNKYKDSECPWESFAKQPDLVYFSHIAVMKNNKQARCASCHGNKANAVNTAMVEGKMHMGKCMDCHDALKISNKCAVCHD